MDREKEIKENFARNVPAHINRMYLDSAIFSGDNIILPNVTMADRFKKHYRAKLNGYDVTYKKDEQSSIPDSKDTGLPSDNSRTAPFQYSPIKEKIFPSNKIYSCFIHTGNRVVRNGLEALANKVRYGTAEGVRYVFSGLNESGKSYLAKSVLSKLSEDGFPVAYIDTNEIIRAYGKTAGNGGIPEVVERALDSRMIILDEINKIHSPGNGLRSGTPKGIIHLLDVAEEKGVPVAMFYTGNDRDFAKMTYDLSSKKGDGDKEKLARDLGSRLGSRVYGKIGRLGKNSVKHFVSHYLMQKDDLPSNIAGNIGEVVEAISKYIPDNYGFRKLTSDIDAVLFNASYGGKQIFGADDVAEVLGFSEQGGAFREGVFADEVIESVARFTEIAPASIRRRGRSPRISSARGIVAWTLVNNGWTHEEATDCLPISRTTATNLIKKINGLVDGTLNPDKKNDRRLRDLAIKWKAESSFDF